MRYILLSTVASAIIFSGAARALANDVFVDQIDGGANIFTATQTGTDNVITGHKRNGIDGFTQRGSGFSEATIDQAGSHSGVFGDQNSGAGGDNRLTVRQNLGGASYNQVNVKQVGLNTATIDQEGAGAKRDGNIIGVRQDNDGNAAANRFTALQDATLGGGNVIGGDGQVNGDGAFYQNGSGNVAELYQYGSGGHNSGNEIYGSQEGDGNEMIATQTGGGNRFAARQYGDNNTISSIQTGNNNTIAGLNGDAFEQDNSTGGAFHHAALTQSGDENIVLGNQHGDGNALSATQIGDGNILHAYQDGDGLTATVSQASAGGNDFTSVRQEGTGHTATVTQY